jgi:cytochrome c553
LSWRAFVFSDRNNDCMKLALFCVAGVWASGVAAAADLAAGAAKAQARIVCHGPGGISQTAETPSLAGQPAAFLQWQLVLFRSGNRKSPVMQPMAARRRAF